MPVPSDQRLTRDDTMRGSWSEVAWGVALLLAIVLACVLGPAWIGEGSSAISDNRPSNWPRFENSQEGCPDGQLCTDVAARSQLRN